MVQRHGTRPAKQLLPPLGRLDVVHLLRGPRFREHLHHGVVEGLHQAGNANEDLVTGLDVRGDGIDDAGFASKVVIGPAGDAAQSLQAYNRPVLLADEVRALEGLLVRKPKLAFSQLDALHEEGRRRPSWS